MEPEAEFMIGKLYRAIMIFRSSFCIEFVDEVSRIVMDDPKDTIV
jgi:hypothetical protein